MRNPESKSRCSSLKVLVWLAPWHLGQGRPLITTWLLSMASDFCHVLGYMVGSTSLTSESLQESEAPLFSGTEGALSCPNSLNILGFGLVSLELHSGCLWLWFYVFLSANLGLNHGILCSWRSLSQSRLTEGNLILTFFLQTCPSLFLPKIPLGFLMLWQGLGLECTL